MLDVTVGGLHYKIVNHTDDLPVIRHNGLAPEFSEELPHPSTAPVDISPIDKCLRPQLAHGPRTGEGEMRTTFRNAACERKTAQWGFLSLRVSLGPFPNQKTRYSPGLPGNKISSSNPGESEDCGKIFGEKEGEGGADSFPRFTPTNCPSLAPQASVVASLAQTGDLRHDLEQLVARLADDLCSAVLHRQAERYAAAPSRGGSQPFPRGHPRGSFPGDEWGVNLGLD